MKRKPRVWKGWMIVFNTVEADHMGCIAAAESAPREMPAWVTRGTFDEMAAEAKRLTARVQWLEAECARWKFDADTTREAHICTHRRAEKIEAENARLRAPRVGVESVIARLEAAAEAAYQEDGYLAVDPPTFKAILRECWPAASKDGE